jgi:hypothetical protein
MTKRGKNEAHDKKKEKTRDNMLLVKRKKET